MKIAVVGTGISGLTTAYLLSQKHDVIVYEAVDRLGGHTATMDINHNGRPYSIDTGFIVFNDWTYPNFQKLLQRLNVQHQPTDMGFSVRCDKTGLEYSGDSLDTLFTQRKNVFSIKHWVMLKDILRFNKQAPIDLAKGGNFNTMTLGTYLSQRNYSSQFIDYYLIPMGAAIWSSSTAAMQQFPLRFFVNFFKNHGLLSVNDRPQWHVIKGGSASYIDPLIEPFKENIQLNTPVVAIRREQSETTKKVIVSTANGKETEYDHVVLACHSDQALPLLADANSFEQDVLGAMSYKMNEVVLHTDETLLPKNKKAWASWNYQIRQDDTGLSNEPPALTYNMNILQSIQSPSTFCVTLNHTSAIDPEKIIGVYHYSHPVFSLDTVIAQQRWDEINGHHNTWFCGAYWANGFHEDGVNSALRVCEQFGVSL